MENQQSLVYWLPDKDKQNCGYCKGTSVSVQYGMWAQSLTVDDYQSLIDRGWRRSGQYCYKPVLRETCCPLYTIRCEALNFRPSKSQKKVIKKFNKFLNDGIIKERETRDVPEENDDFNEFVYKQRPSVNVDALTQFDVTEISDKNEAVDDKKKKKRSDSDTEKTVKKGLGADPSKPPCKKAKLIRMEKKLKKLENNIQKCDVPKQQTKSLDDFMNETSASDKHKLTVKLVEPTNTSGNWQEFEQLEFELFKKYQCIIHNDPPHKNTLAGFRRFLIDTPLERKSASNSTTSDTPAYNSYHQQYWLDDKLIAVGVIDILPKCISAVYFFYDPDYRELTLGTFGALKEIELSRQLNSTLNIEYYYMGYYIHNCQKMRYKAHMTPSFLLCPETYVWFPVDKCLEKLDESPYSRFNDDLNAKDVDECLDDDLDNLKIVFNGRFCRYVNCKKHLGKECDFETLAKLLGKKCTRSMFIIKE